jgi:hypothetical protein
LGVARRQERDARRDGFSGVYAADEQDAVAGVYGHGGVTDGVGQGADLVPGAAALVARDGL